MTKNYNDLGVEFKYLIVNDMDQKFGLETHGIYPRPNFWSISFTIKYLNSTPKSL